MNSGTSAFAQNRTPYAAIPYTFSTVFAQHRAAKCRAEVKRRGFTQALRQVVIDDGDPWIWKISEEVFPQALQIVDRYHVKEHLSQVAKALYGQVETAIAGLDVGTKNWTRAAGGVSPGRWPVMRGQRST